MAKKHRINGRLKAEGQIIVLECDGNGRAKVLEKVKGFREPAVWFVQCKGCAKCKRHLTKRAADGLTRLAHSLFTDESPLSKVTRQSTRR